MLNYIIRAKSPFYINSPIDLITMCENKFFENLGSKNGGFQNIILILAVCHL